MFFDILNKISGIVKSPNLLSSHLYKLLFLTKTDTHKSPSGRLSRSTSPVRKLKRRNLYPTRRSTALTMKATIQAIMHCQMTTFTAHFMPISRLMEATAATHGV